MYALLNFIWGSHAKIYINKLQIYQNKRIHTITDALWLINDQAQLKILKS